MWGSNHHVMEEDVHKDIVPIMDHHLMEEDVHKDIPIIGVTLNALNLIAGASFVGIPYALKQSGLVIGLLILVLMCYLTGNRCDI